MTSRYHLLESGQLLLPANCSSCGSSQNNRKYVDLGLSIEFYGSIYFCEFCFASVAEDLEYVPLSAHASLQAQFTNASSYISTLEYQNEAIKRAMAAILTTSFSFDGSVDDLVGRIVSSVKDSFESIGADSATPVHVEGSNKSKRVKGSGNVLPAPADSVDS